MAMDRTTALIPAAHCAWQRVGEEMVVVDLRNRVVRGLNPVGSLIWSLLDGKTPVEAVIDRVSKEFAGRIDREAVSLDVEKFLNRLREAGLLQ